eukprot:1850299-Rhodomonas_salina.2
MAGHYRYISLILFLLAPTQDAFLMNTASSGLKMLNNQRRMETALHRATLLRGPRLGYHPRLRAEIGSRNKAWWSQLRMDEKGTGTVAEEEDVVVEDAAADSSAAEMSQVGREDASLEDVESASVLEQYRAPIAIGALATLGVVIAAAHPSFDTASLPSFLAKNSPFVTFLMAGTAAMTAEAVTYPFDSIKTRKQLKFEPSTSNEPDTIISALLISLHMSLLISSLDLVSSAHEQESRLHNLRSLYFGVRVAVLRHLPYSGTRLMVYEQLRAVFPSPSSLPPSHPLSLSLFLSFYLSLDTSLSLSSRSLSVSLFHHAWQLLIHASPALTPPSPPPPPPPPPPPSSNSSPDLRCSSSAGCDAQQPLRGRRRDPSLPRPRRRCH